jgi:peroxiredoxin Q/BCP
MVESGNKAPNFCLPNGRKEEICLEDYRGKWIVLYFYPKDNSPGCTREAINFNSNLTPFSERNAVILGVSPDSPKNHQRFTDQHDLAFQLLSDESREVLEQYDAWKKGGLLSQTFLSVKRSTYLIDPEGIIVAYWPKVKVKGHAEEVLEKIDEMQKH